MPDARSASNSGVLNHSLEAYLGEGPADPAVLQIFYRVLVEADALSASGSAHPPLSPQSIQLDDSNQPHIRSSSRAHENTETVAFGSAKYSAPEAFQYGVENFRGETADCYVLGFIFYEILIGKRLFSAQFASVESGSPSLWLKWHADKNLKARPLSELRPSLGDFASTIDQMMEKDPAKRINSISRVLRVFSGPEAQTTYQDDTVVPKSGASAALPSWRVAAGVLLALIVCTFAALLLHRLIFSVPTGQTPKRPARKAASKLAPPVPSAIALPRTESAPATRPVLETTLQVESHLDSASLFLDDRPPAQVSQDQVLSQTIAPGRHEFRFVHGSHALLRFVLNVGDDGDVSLVEPLNAQSLRFVILAGNQKAARLYASPEARAGLPGESYEPVPEDGRLITNNQPVFVSFNHDSKAQIRLEALTAASIRIVLEPTLPNLLVPVEVRANAPDANIIVNGEKLAQKLDHGASLLHLPAGEYHVHLVRSGYQDSTEQRLVIKGNEPRLQLQFALSAIQAPAKLAVSSIPAGEATTAVANQPGPQLAKPLGKITFHITPETAQISCRRSDDSQSRVCMNNQPCVLPAGTYEISAKADGFKSELWHIAIAAGEERPYQSKLEPMPAPTASSPGDVFENGQTWTVDSGGWWTHTQPGYSFMRPNQGTFVFDIVKSSGLFASRKVQLVVNYKGDGNRVLYTLDEHKLRRNQRIPGIQMADLVVTQETPRDSNYRLTVELSADRAIIRNAAGQILDNLPLTNAAAGKIGFLGKLKLRIVQAR